MTTAFTASSTAAEVLAGVDLTGRRAVVTGGASGIGLVTARALAAAGADVTVAVRDTSAVEGLAARRLDLADRASIAEFTAAWDGPLHILVNNAGIMALPELTRTANGWERQFAVNHLGPAALTLGLHDALAEAGDARVVNVASSAHLMAQVDLDDPHFERTPYEAWTAYARSKTAMILFTVALAERWAADGITANALHPGGIMTNLQRHLDEAQLGFVGALDGKGDVLAVPPGWKTPEQGASTSVLLAGSPLVAAVTAQYFEDNAVAPLQPEPAPGASGVAPYALDPALANRVWEETLRMLG
ncbi:SDR family NAD(P)-dependent oxidoreductase [Amycolatopsis rhabdoformis]|uniref:SDR family NAD(P)-dependent oxidoreductase n=1 Tax=Amycolatopsis rhabdoformis TaxID=1448059 RepID=A0ABZ1IE42_9PSEU|nr:SDR family NAD(P)-dependent oxidoreductase [Amycolatopsis rhabdoformis]WSE32720.1 SDR family NAD(P)-dependent oxidoreductase [Amycolatopsis rhabdoformis]